MAEYDPFLSYVEEVREKVDFKKSLDDRKQDVALLRDVFIAPLSGTPLEEKDPPPPPPMSGDEGDFGALGPPKKYWNPQGGITDKPTLGPPISTMGRGQMDVIPSHVAAKYTMSGKRLDQTVQDSFIESARKGAESIPGIIKQHFGGRMRMMGDLGIAGAGGGEGWTGVGPASEEDRMTPRDPNWQAQVMGQDLFREGRKEIEATLPDVEAGSLKAHVYGAAQSLGLSTAAFTASVLTGSTLPLLALAELSAGQEYGAQREGGSDVGTAILGSVVNGLAEYWGERLPFMAWMKAPGFFQKMVASSLMDSAGELGTQAVQSAVQKLTYQPGMTWDDFTTTMKDTLIQSLMAGGVQTGVIGGVQATQKTDIGRTDFKGWVEENFQGSKVDFFQGGANVTLPSGRVVEIHTSESEKAPELEEAVGKTKKAKGVDDKTVVSGVYYKTGDLTLGSNDLIYLTGNMTDLTTLPHEKGHLVIEVMRDIMSPEELSAIGIPATGRIDENLEEGVMKEFEEYTMKRTPTPERPMSELDKAFQKVVDFAHEVYTTFGGETTQRQVFEQMRTGKILTREGAVKLPGESDVMFQRRSEEPPWYKDPPTTKSGRIIGAPYSHQDPGAFQSLVQKMFNVASDMHEVNPGQADWYDKAAGDAIRSVFGLKKDPKTGEWTGRTKDADRFMRAVAAWSVRMPVGRNAMSAIQAISLMNAGKRPRVAGAVVGADTMMERFEIMAAEPEFSHKLEGVGPKVDSFYWDLHNAVYEIPDKKNVTIDSHMIQAMGLFTDTGRPMEALKNTQYAWARKVIEEATKKFNDAHGTDYSARQVQALIWDWNRAGQVAQKIAPEDFSLYLKDAKLQARELAKTTSISYTIRDWDGNDANDQIRAVAISESEALKKRLQPADRIWLMPDGRAIWLLDFERHDTRAQRIADRASVTPREYIRDFMFGGAMGAIRFHGIQAGAGKDWGPSEGFAIEIYGPLSKANEEIISKALGTNKGLLADVTDPRTGNVVTYAMGKGQAGLASLKAAAAKAYGHKAKGKMQTRETVETPAGEFPLNHNGWVFQGEMMGFYQYTLRDPKRPNFTPTLLVDKPENLPKKIETTLKKFEGGKLQARPTKVMVGKQEWSVKEYEKYQDWKAYQKERGEMSAMAMTDFVTKVIHSPTEELHKNLGLDPQYIWEHELAHIEVSQMEDADEVGERVLDAARRGDKDMVTPTTIKYYKKVQKMIDEGYAMNEATLQEEILAEEIANQNIAHKKAKGKFQTRTPGPKGLTVNFTSPEVTALGEELLQGAFDKLAFTQSNEESIKKAQELIRAGKMNLETFLSHDPFTAWPDTAHQVAAEMIAGGVFDYVKGRIAEFKAGTITAQEAMQARAVGMAAVASWYLPQSEVGRMLQARQMAITPEGIPVRDLMEEQMAFERDIQDKIDKGLVTEEEVLTAMDQFYSVDQARNFQSRVLKSKEPSVLNQLFYFSLLSNPVTQAANIIGNLGPLFFAVADQYVSEMNPFRATPRGGAAGMMAGLYHGVLDAFILAGRAGYTGETSMGSDKFRNPRPTGVVQVDSARAMLEQIMSDKTHPYHNRQDPDHADAVNSVMRLHRTAFNPISGERLSRFTSGKIDADSPFARLLDYLGEGIDAPFKGLAAGDEFFKVINYRMYIYKAAYEMAAGKGLEGRVFDEFVATFVESPPASAEKTAQDFAAKQTFTSETGPIASVFQSWNREYPAFRVIVPFVKVIGNIMKYNLEHTPFSLFLRQTRADIKQGGVARDLAISKIAVGSSMMLAFAGLAAAGFITGGGPSDPKLKKIWSQPDKDGNVAWQEYSFKIGKTWISYKRIEPFATPIGVAADLIEIARYAPDFGLDEGVIAGAISFARNFTSKTYAQGISNFLEAITSGGADTMQGNAARWIRSTLGMAVPGGVAQLARVVDPTKRDVDGWIDRLKSRVPGLSSSIEPALNLRGDVMTVQMYESIPGKGLGMVNPIAYTGDSDDVVTKEIIRNRVPVSMPSRQLGGGRNPDSAMFDEGSTAIELTPEQYGWFVRMSGNGLKDPADGRGAWDKLTAIINGMIPVEPARGDRPAVYYRDFSDGPNGGKAAIIGKVLHKYRDVARDMIERGDQFPDVRASYQDKQIRKKMNLVPRVGGGR